MPHPSTARLHEPSPFARLPTEVLKLILHQLSDPSLFSCLLVSRRLSALAREELWRAPPLSAFESVIAPTTTDAVSIRSSVPSPSSLRHRQMDSLGHTLQPLLQVGRLVRSISVCHRDMTKATPAVLWLILWACPHLRSLSLDAGHDHVSNRPLISSAFLLQSVSFASSLRSLSLGTCDLQDQTLAELARLCGPTLSQLALTDCSAITEPALVNFISQTPGLKAVELGSFQSYLGTFSNRLLAGEALVMALADLSHLERLSIGHGICSVHKSWMVGLSPKFFPSLRSLIFAASHDTASPEAMCVWISHLRSLSELSLAGDFINEAVVEQSVLATGRTLKALHLIQASQMTIRALHLIAEHCPMVRSLQYTLPRSNPRLSVSPGWYDGAVADLLDKCLLLESLALNTGRYVKFHDSSLEQIMPRAMCLRDLKLSTGQFQISDEFLSRCEDRGLLFPSLQALSFSLIDEQGCFPPPQRIVRFVELCCPVLKAFDCGNISIWREVTQALPTIRHLSW
ncbi:uncharacterized protein BJ171DRAFT_566135 [Polychytrium aggregatum]|uniref:uncharacterized protein n=1 Tax=Polychytrium aggregatum TaxID=110093 RepID=UPI0022FF3C23|nr:uncharacterized protein BJ171DRAFT_566135 [Polychytrium aggregatum]KAI9207342.1 hypothetical protein BJ171DRAFT_566135 [Polychytrium aggregatum]